MQNQPVQPESPEQLLMTLRILWAAILSSSFILVFISYQNFSGEIVEFEGINLFYFVALAVLVISHILPKVVFKQALAQAPKPATENQIFTSYFTSFILSIALSEAITLLGFVSVTTTHEPKRILPFVAVGVLNMIYFFPDKDRILQKAKALTF